MSRVPFISYIYIELLGKQFIEEKYNPIHYCYITVSLVFLRNDYGSFEEKSREK